MGTSKSPEKDGFVLTQEKEDKSIQLYDFENVNSIIKNISP